MHLPSVPPQHYNRPMARYHRAPVEAGANRFTEERSFCITYGVVDRLWCNTCDKAETLPDLTEATVEVLKARHICGPRTSPWDSRR